MNKWMDVTASLARDESGATAIEYALIAAILSISIIAGLTSLQVELGQTFETVIAAFNS